MRPSGILYTLMTSSEPDGTSLLQCKDSSVYLISLIVVTCGLGPFTLAFPDVQEDRLRLIDYIMNGIFTLDIVINFISAYHTSDYSIVDDPKVRINSFSYFPLGNCQVLPS
jgi:hypothetical protein